MKPTSVYGAKEKLMLCVNPPPPSSSVWMDEDGGVFFALIGSLFIFFFCLHTACGLKLIDTRH